MKIYITWELQKWMRSTSTMSVSYTHLDVYKRQFQDSAVSRARSNIRSLLDVRPERATVIRDGHDVIEKPERISVGEIIEIKVGERVPLDGTMLGDVAAFNTAALTGESVPRNIRTGETVLAGMIVTDRVVRVKVTKSYNQSALARILEMVQNASCLLYTSRADQTACSFL